MVYVLILYLITFILWVYVHRRMVNYYEKQISILSRKLFNERRLWEVRIHNAIRTSNLLNKCPTFEIGQTIFFVSQGTITKGVLEQIDVLDIFKSWKPSYRIADYGYIDRIFKTYADCLMYLSVETN